jgi:hypothetical protein
MAHVEKNDDISDNAEMYLKNLEKFISALI